MTSASDPIAASLDRQIADYRELYELLVAETQHVESGDYDTLATCCELMRQVRERIERSSATTLEGTTTAAQGTGSVGQTDGMDSQHTGSGKLHGSRSSRSSRPGIDSDSIQSRVFQIRALIGQIESLRAGIVRGLGQARKDLVEEMNQLTAGAEATKGYYKPQGYRGARYFDRSQ